LILWQAVPDHLQHFGSLVTHSAVWGCRL